MTRRLRAWWPTVVYVVIVILALAWTRGNDESLVDIGVNLTVYSAFSFVGGWIASRSENPMGRLFQLLAIVSASLFMTEAYLGRALSPDHQGLPDGGLAVFIVWANNLLFVPFFILNFVLPFFLFPTGRPASRRWSYVVRAALVWVVLVSAATLVAPIVELDDALGGNVTNPWAIGFLATPAAFLTDHVFDVISLLGLLAVASLVFRYRASGAEQRAQIRWFLLAGLFLILSLILDEVLLDALPIEAPAIEQAIELAVLLVGLLGLPVATAIAILKYRLYEVDVVINKTLVYAGLTAVLAGVYVLLVVAMPRLLPGIAQDSDLAVAAATLAVAGLFRPMRSRLQTFIDHRFYRRKYDAVETLQGFSSHLRDQVDLTALSRELVAVAGTTMQPAHASLWLRRQEGPR